MSLRIAKEESPGREIPETTENFPKLRIVYEKGRKEEDYQNERQSSNTLKDMLRGAAIITMAAASIYGIHYLYTHQFSYNPFN